MSRSKEELIVNGFIREIQILLSKHIIFPVDIIRLILIFYGKLWKFIMMKRFIDEIRILHGDTKQISTLKYKALTGESRISPPVRYIQNISSQLNTLNMDNSNNKSYDGIFCIKNYKFPMFLVFESDKLNEEEIECKMIRAMRCLDDYHLQPSQMQNILYCGEEYGLIYEHSGKLYELILDRVNDPFSFLFKPLIENNQIWTHQSNTWSYFGSESYLSLAFVPKSQAVFAIHNSYVSREDHAHWNVRKPDDGSDFIMQAKKCGIFDLKTRKWRELESLNIETYWRDINTYCHFECCVNEYDNNELFAVSNVGNTQRFDFNKNEWNEIVKDGLILSKRKRHNIWMDNVSVICCVSGDGKYFGYVDVRENKPKWTQLTDFDHLKLDVFALAKM